MLLLHLLLHVAMQTGLYLHRHLMLADVWRVVSEDSDDIGTRLASIHGLGHCDDLQQPIDGEMLIRHRLPQTLSKLQKIKILRSSHRILNKERDDRFVQILPFSNNIPIQMFLVVVISSIHQDLTYPKEVLKSV